MLFKLSKIDSNSDSLENSVKLIVVSEAHLASRFWSWGLNWFVSHVVGPNMFIIISHLVSVGRVHMMQTNGRAIWGVNTRTMVRRPNASLQEEGHDLLSQKVEQGIRISEKLVASMGIYSPVGWLFKPRCLIVAALGLPSYCLSAPIVSLSPSIHFGTLPANSFLDTHHSMLNNPYPTLLN